MEKECKLETRRIWLFLLITFAMTYAWSIGLIWPRVLGRDMASFTAEETIINTALTAMLMFFPAIGVLITRLITREGFKNAMLRLNLKGNVRYYLIGWFGPIVLTLLGAVRELLGTGRLFDCVIYPEDYGMLLFVLAPGAFLALGYLIAIVNKLRNLK